MTLFAFCDHTSNNEVQIVGMQFSLIMMFLQLRIYVTLNYVLYNSISYDFLLPTHLKMQRVRYEKCLKAFGIVFLRVGKV